MLHYVFVIPNAAGSLEEGRLLLRSDGTPLMYPLVIAKMLYRIETLADFGWVIAEISQNGKLLTQVDS